MAVSAVQAEVRVVDANAAVQSTKRGVAANSLSAADFAALKPGVSWWYNWATTPGNVPSNTGMSFMPMVWGNDQGSLNSLNSYLAAGNRPRQILAVNEPNLRGQAFINPETTADVYRKVKNIVAPYGIPVSGPQMALGSAAGDSITAPDPVTGVNETYTYMVPFVKDFKVFAGRNNTTVDSIGYHVYGDINEFKWSIGEAVNNFGTPVQVTEFAWWDAPNAAAELNYMIQAVDYMERNPSVQTYAWFKERASNNNLISLLNSQSGSLTTLGKAYVNMPVHDPDVYYRASGRLQAERYVTLTNMDIGATSDANGGSDSLADMTATGANGKVTYNLFVEQGGLYQLSLRVMGEWGQITLLDGTDVIGTVWMDAGGWRTLTTQVQLDQGYDSLSIQFQRVGQVFNWMEFTAIPEPAHAGVMGMAACALLARRRGRVGLLGR